MVRPAVQGRRDGIVGGPGEPKHESCPDLEQHTETCAPHPRLDPWATRRAVPSLRGSPRQITDHDSLSDVTRSLPEHTLRIRTFPGRTLDIPIRGFHLRTSSGDSETRARRPCDLFSYSRVLARNMPQNGLSARQVLGQIPSSRRSISVRRPYSTRGSPTKICSLPSHSVAACYP